jgi:hypothetical protein
MRKVKMRWFLLMCLVAGLAGLAGCDGDNGGQIFIPLRPTTRATPIATNTPTATATATPAGSPTPSATPTLAPEACLPSSSIGVLVQGTNAIAYAPKGSWGCSSSTGVNVVPIETSAGIGTGAAATTVSTANTVNSCSSNSATGETVCTANNTDVYLINGSTLTNTLTSTASGTVNFTGGSCTNCGVVIDSTTNTAFIAESVSGSSLGGFQMLDLATNTFAAPIQSGTGISEDIAVDPVRHLILSPNEGFTSGTSNGFYELVQIQPSTALFENQIVPIPTPTPVGAPVVNPDLDSAAEDCTTGIALSTDEFTGNLFITDLTQATFTPGTPTGTWSAPGQFQYFPEFDPSGPTPPGLSAGTSGIAVAPGTHLAIVTGEFGGNIEGVVQLPSTSGSGIPAAPDWVQFTVPNEPAPVSGPFSMGCDPHTVTAYVSPNSGKALGILGDGSASFLAIVDLQGILSATRTAGTHIVDPSVDLIASHLVTFVAQ